MGDRIGIADNSHIIIYVRTITLKLLFNNLTIYYPIIFLMIILQSFLGLFLLFLLLLFYLLISLGYFHFYLLIHPSITIKKLK